jgi:hypothetical protein
MTAIPLFSLMFAFAQSPSGLAALGLFAVVAILAGAAGAVALGAYYYPKLKNEKQGYAYEAEIEALLLPWIYKAIAGAYKLSERASDEVGMRIEGLDKKGIADAMYDALPKQIGNVPLGMVKLVISRERFAQLVQLAFDEFLEFYDSQETYYGHLYEQWVEDNVI